MRCRRRRGRPATRRVTEASHEHRVADRLDAAAMAAQLAGALASLSEGDRDVLLLTSWAGLDSTEVADALDIPVGTVRSRLHRVRKWLRANAPKNSTGRRAAMPEDNVASHVVGGRAGPGAGRAPGPAWTQTTRGLRAARAELLVAAGAPRRRVASRGAPRRGGGLVGGGSGGRGRRGGSVLVVQTVRFGSNRCPSAAARAAELGGGQDQCGRRAARPRPVPLHRHPRVVAGDVVSGRSVLLPRGEPAGDLGAGGRRRNGLRQET